MFPINLDNSTVLKILYLFLTSIFKPSVDLVNAYFRFLHLNVSQSGFIISEMKHKITILFFKFP